MTRLLFVALASLLASQSALACGGFFCNTAQPVVQDAERIAFAIDPDGFVEAHVQIFYQGPADEFAWVVPVPADPEIFLASDALFDTLSLQMAPVFQLNFRDEGNCKEGGFGIRLAQNDAFMAESGGTVMSDGGASVTVTQKGQVGPYDMVVIQGSDSGVLLDWLVDNGYDLPPGIEPVLAPYVAGDAYFLALKLAKDRDTGDIAPIGFRYPGDAPAVPIQLTSIAAADDMRLETYVFGAERAVPESYLHVRINEAAVDWWNQGQNYPDVITLAADEAGGHAFATDFAGSPDFLRGMFYERGRIDLAPLRAAASFQRLVDTIRDQGWIPSQQLQSTLLQCVDAPAGVDETDFVNCPDCYSWDQSSFDANICADLLNRGVLDPLRSAEDLMDYAWVSRMTSSLSASEMTVDPVFTLNPDMGRVDNQHSADFVYECTGGKKRSKAMRRLDLEDGRSILIPSEKWMDETNSTPFEFIADLGAINAAIIEQTGPSGTPSVIMDYSEELFSQVDAHNKNVLGMIGCGCSSTGSTGGLWLAGLALFGMASRRR